MAWNEDWTVEDVEQNFEVLGKDGVDVEDIVQLIKDKKTLDKLTRLLDDAGVFQLDDEWAREVKRVATGSY